METHYAELTRSVTEARRAIARAAFDASVPPPVAMQRLEAATAALRRIATALPERARYATVVPTDVSGDLRRAGEEGMQAVVSVALSVSLFKTFWFHHPFR